MDRYTQHDRFGHFVPLASAECGEWTLAGKFEKRLYGDAASRLAAYEDTGLTPGDVKDLQELCKENGLAKYVDLIVEAKRQMGIDNERSIEQAERIEQLEAENARLRAERDKAVEEINLVFGRVRALADCDGYHPYENVCDLCAFFDGGEKRECHGNCKNARWRGTEGKA